MKEIVLEENDINFVVDMINKVSTDGYYSKDNRSSNIVCSGKKVSDGRYIITFANTVDKKNMIIVLGIDFMIMDNEDINIKNIFVRKGKLISLRSGKTFTYTQNKELLSKVMDEIDERFFDLLNACNKYMMDKMIKDNTTANTNNNSIAGYVFSNIRDFSFAIQCIATLLGLWTGEKILFRISISAFIVCAISYVLYYLFNKWRKA